MTRPVLRYFGGKYRLASWVISHFPEHRIYVEPFGGAASVLMKKQKSHAEIYNDLDDSVFNLFSVLRNESLAKELKSLIDLTPYSRREFELAHVYHPDKVESARRLIIRSFMGFGADSVTKITSKTGFRSNSNKSGSTPAHDWCNYSHNIPEFQKRLSSVVLENKDAMQVMLDHDSIDTLHYLDPPYHHSTRRSGRYKHEMDNQAHIDLIEFVKTLKGRVIISGYDTDLYNSLNWKKTTKEARANGSKATVECLWMNY